MCTYTVKRQWARGAGAAEEGLERQENIMTLTF